MQQFQLRLLLFIGLLLAIGAVVLGLSQSISYKPWGVKDNQREKYDRLVAELETKAEIRETAASQPRPIVALSATSYDFGWVAVGESVETEFEILNAGRLPLQLEVKSTDCDCATATLTKSHLAPDETSLCLVKYIPNSASGSGSRKILLATNDPLSPHVSLLVNSRIKQEVVIPKKIQLVPQDIADPSTLKFIIYSQVHDKFDVHSISSNQDGHRVDWAITPVIDFDSQLGIQSAESAYSLSVSVTPPAAGRFEGILSLELQLPGKESTVSHSLSYSGQVRPPVAFYGPEIDARSGLDLGSLESGKRHDFFVTVRSRADKTRKIAVLDVEPKALQTELIESAVPGAYRLRITVPADCPNLQYNLDSNRGYVKVGDAESRSYSNWLPIYLSVSDTSQDDR